MRFNFSELPAFNIAYGSTGGSGIFGIARNMEIYVVHIGQLGENIVGLGHIGEISGQHHIFYLVDFGGKHSHHAYGLKYKIDYTEGQV